MFDLGDAMIVDNSRVPWLLWIQLLVIFLLIFLLYSFGLVAFDLSDSATDAQASITSSSTSQVKPPNQDNSSTALVQNSEGYEFRISCSDTRGRERQDGRNEIVSATTERREIREETTEREDFQTKKGPHLTVSVQFLYPCYYFKLARGAFLKCLGLDSETVSSKEHVKED